MHTREPDWESAPAFGRRESILLALRRLWELHPGPACIVETGTLRNDSSSGQSGDGWSTVAWGWYCSQVGGRAYTIDVDAGAIEVCRRVTAPYAAHIEYVVADSVQFLRNWPPTIPAPCQPPGPSAPAPASGEGKSEIRNPKSEIHLLYLDSLDYLDRERSENHCLAEAEAALPSLAAPCLALFDDTSPTGPPGEDGLPPLVGKGTQAVPFLVSRRFRVEWAAGGQVLVAR